MKNSELNHELENDKIKRQLYQDEIKDIIGRDITKPHYSKKGILIEHPRWSKAYAMHLLLRTMAFAFDFMIPGAIQYLMYIALEGSFGSEIKWIFSGLVSMVYFHIYFVTTMAILKGRTIGLALAKMCVVHKSGFSTGFTNYYFRGLISSIYSIPWIGWMLAGVNAITLLTVFRGVSLTDLLSGTVLVTTKRREELLAIERMQ